MRLMTIALNLVLAAAGAASAQDRVKYRERGARGGDETATGWIKVRRKGSDKVYRFKVKNGVAIVKLPAFNKPGTKKLVVRYLGSDAVKRDKMVVKLKIRR